jgi:hypothetical protein
MITEQLPIKYIVVVNGVPISGQLPTKRIAEATILTLPITQQSIAEIRVVTTSGTELLLG